MTEQDKLVEKAWLAKEELRNAMARLSIKWSPEQRAKYGFLKKRVLITDTMLDRIITDIAKLR